MEPEAHTIEDRLARLEGQYHALSRELTDNFRMVHDSLDTIKRELDDIHTVKSGMLKSEKLSDVVKRMDDQLQEMQRQLVAVSNQIQIDRR